MLVLLPVESATNETRFEKKFDLFLENIRAFDKRPHALKQPARGHVERGGSHWWYSWSPWMGPVRENGWCHTQQDTHSQQSPTYLPTYLSGFERFFEIRSGGLELVVVFFSFSCDDHSFSNSPTIATNYKRITCKWQLIIVFVYEWILCWTFTNINHFH